MPAWSGEGPLQGHRLLTVSSHGRRARELCGVSFIRALIPFVKAPPPDTITLRGRISTHEFWRGRKHSDHSTHSWWD